MSWLIGLASLAVLLIVLRDAFETIILPRRVRRRFQLTRLFYRPSWRLWRVAARFSGRFQESSLGWFGPFSLLALLALWAVMIIVAFGGLHWAVGSALRMDTTRTPGFLDDLYLSGTTFFTLGLGDVLPLTTPAKLLTVTEAGLGFAFLAVVIGYLPVIYQAFSRREIAISMLDARAGSPPVAGELLWRFRGDGAQEALSQLLADWERWSAEVLESHLSYPVLAYFRSQHGNQSWLAALTTVLDTSALVLAGLDGWKLRQAELTFAMARHAVVDLTQVFNAPRPQDVPDRLPEPAFEQLLAQLGRTGIKFSEPDARERLTLLRGMYEPYVVALSRHLELPLPLWSSDPKVTRRDNWQAAPWKPTAPEHFESGP